MRRANVPRVRGGRWEIFVIWIRDVGLPWLFVATRSKSKRTGACLWLGPCGANTLRGPLTKLLALSWTVAP